MTTLKVFLKKGFVYETDKIDIKGIFIHFTDKYGKQQYVRQEDVKNIKEE